MQNSVLYNAADFDIGLGLKIHYNFGIRPARVMHRIVRQSLKT